MNDTALPYRQLGAFLPGIGAGGAGLQPDRAGGGADLLVGEGDSRAASQGARADGPRGR